MAYVTFGGVTSSMTIKASRTLCFPGSLDSDKVRGKIVVCTRGVNARVEKGLVVKQAGSCGLSACGCEPARKRAVARKRWEGGRR
uniref:PA domain-containing protein n=1 Tax=Oryza meridionalis TaxID=40149 RepID=A0A0E0CQM5_9ORYZ